MASKGIVKRLLILRVQEFGTSHYHSLPAYNQVRKSLRLKNAEPQAHIILAPYIETMFQLQLICNGVSVYG